MLKIDEVVSLAVEYDRARTDTNNAQLALDIAVEELKKAREREEHYRTMVQKAVLSAQLEQVKNEAKSPFNGIKEGAEAIQQGRVLTLEGTAHILPSALPRRHRHQAPLRQPTDEGMEEMTAGQAGDAECLDEEGATGPPHDSVTQQQ